MTQSTTYTPIQKSAADAIYGGAVLAMRVWERLNFKIISTGRNFEFYRRVLFLDVPADELLASLQGKVYLDIGCGHTPYLSDSMFQRCEAEGIAFYGIDPKLDGDLQDNMFNTLMHRGTGARGRYDRSAPGTRERAIAGYADNLPFEDGSVHGILSSFLMFIWLRDDAILARTMQEFNRVLAPGGEVRLYPMPSIDEMRRRYPAAMQVVEDYKVEQTFVRSGNFASPSGFVTVLRKP